MDNYEKIILITGGAGFIGSHTVRFFVHKYPLYKIVCLDALTYAGNLENLKDIEHAANYVFIKGDINNEKEIDAAFESFAFTHVIHLAAESHVDRSIIDPLAFLKTNVMGTAILLNACRKYWEKHSVKNLFYHVSTDEVYGSLGAEGLFTEKTAYDPRSPYSASKAASDHFVMAYYHTYDLPVILSNCSNNYGSNHFPEKLIPLMINNIRNNRPLPVYGKGENVRDWLWVEDHVRAIDIIFHQGRVGEKYNIGGLNEWKNIDLVYLLCRIMDSKLGREPGTSEKLIHFVQDRPGHDLRYAIDAAKLTTELGWKPSVSFETGLEKTVDWYLANEDWVKHVTSGDYQQYYEEQYLKRY
ncbi:MAG: dTDP-glucose 4,6-dehydratase [Chitinophagaceae bacterium]|nr:dTDP-glucose 4,6-dehydratase [Chitinophagaceae bacterium]